MRIVQKLSGLQSTNDIIPAYIKLDFLQLFRAFAALAVAAAHIAKEVMAIPAFAANPVLYQILSGTFGVDVFFVISGFIMIYTTRNVAGGKDDALSFLSRRIFRIVPTYWFYTSLFLAIVLLQPEVLNRSAVGLAQIIGSYFFIPMPRPSDGVIAPILVLGWTLNYEMYFYAIFAVFLIFPRRWLLSYLSVFLISTVILGLFIDRNFLMFWYWSRSNVLEFLFGALLAHLFLKGVQISILSSLILLLIAILIWQFSYTILGHDIEDPAYRGILWGVPAVLMVGAFSLNPFLREWVSSGIISKPLLAIGDSSYSLYLSHMFVVRALTLMLPISLFGNAYPFIFMSIALAACALFGWASYRWIELPSSSLSKVLTIKRDKKSYV